MQHGSNSDPPSEPVDTGTMNSTCSKAPSRCPFLPLPTENILPVSLFSTIALPRISFLLSTVAKSQVLAESGQEGWADGIAGRGLEREFSEKSVILGHSAAGTEAFCFS